MVTLKELHAFAVEQGIEADPRSEKQIEDLLEEREKEYEKLEGVWKEQYDEDRLENPFDDSKVLWGGEKNVSRLAVGIDMETQDLMLVDRLNEKGESVDGVITHHPEGIGLASLADVMRLQIDTLNQAGIPVSQAEGIVRPRMKEVERGVHPGNHPRAVKAAEKLGLPFMSAHTITDNLAYQYVKEYLDEEEPRTLKDVLDALLEIEEYRWELGQGLGPKIFAGRKDSRTGNIGVLGFTGGTDLNEDLIGRMVDAGIDTLVAMHAKKEQIEKAEEENINVISAGHMSSDSLGMNLFLDAAQDEFGIEVVPLSGFHRVER